MVVPGPMQQKRRGGQREGVKAEGGSKRGWTQETAGNLLIPIKLLDLGLPHEEILDLEALGPILPHTPARQHARPHVVHVVHVEHVERTQVACAVGAVVGAVVAVVASSRSHVEEKEGGFRV